MSFALVTGSSAELGSPARLEPPSREPFTIGLVQVPWDADPSEHATRLREGVLVAAEQEARLVCLQELTLSPYFAVDEESAKAASRFAEPLVDGPTMRFASTLAGETGVAVHASLYEAAGDGRLGYNTAICVGPDGTLLARTRKVHIPGFPGYREDLCFRPGEPSFEVFPVGGVACGFPTCWDQWFPELARIYALRGAEVLVYPTAIGSEPDLEDFDSQPLWRQMIAANGLANATFMVAVNRVGEERGISFYGSSFVSDPYGRVVAQAPRDRPAVVVATLDLDQRRDWLGFGLLSTRRPEAYGMLTR